MPRRCWLHPHRKNIRDQLDVLGLRRHCQRRPQVRQEWDWLKSSVWLRFGHCGETMTTDWVALGCPDSAGQKWWWRWCALFAFTVNATNSSAVAKRLCDASCLSVLSFSSTKRRVESFIVKLCTLLICHCVQLNALVCCLWHNIEASCHKHFVVFSGSQHRRLLPVICHNLRDGGRLLVTAFTTPACSSYDIINIFVKRHRQRATEALWMSQSGDVKTVVIKMSF